MFHVVSTGNGCEPMRFSHPSLDRGGRGGRRRVDRRSPTQNPQGEKGAEGRAQAVGIGVDTVEGGHSRVSIIARPPRIEYAGAVYHVLNRGNYRQDIFAVAASGVSGELGLVVPGRRPPADEGRHAVLPAVSGDDQGAERVGSSSAAASQTAGSARPCTWATSTGSARRSHKNPGTVGKQDCAEPSRSQYPKPDSFFLQRRRSHGIRLLGACTRSTIPSSWGWSPPYNRPSG